MKLFLIQIISTFYIQSSENNNQPINTKEQLTISPEQVWIRLTKRVI